VALLALTSELQREEGTIEENVKALMTEKSTSNAKWNDFTMKLERAIMETKVQIDTFIFTLI
jgi:hypothetical protein